MIAVNLNCFMGAAYILVIVEPSYKGLQSIIKYSHAVVYRLRDYRFCQTIAIIHDDILIGLNLSFSENNLEPVRSGSGALHHKGKIRGK